MSKQERRLQILPTACPSCGAQLVVERLVCPECGTSVQGSYSLPVLCGLSRSDQEFVVEFVKASGSLKEMARLLGVSYPTVRSRLDEIIAAIERGAAEKGSCSD